MLNYSTNYLAMTHINVLYIWPNLRYTKDCQSLSPKSLILVVPILLTMEPTCPIIQMYPQKTQIQELTFILTLASSIRSPSKNLPQPSPQLMLPPNTALAIPPDKISHHPNSSIPSLIYLSTIAIGYPSSGLIHVENLKYQKTSCNSTLNMELLLKPLEDMPLQSMEKYNLHTNP